MNYKRNDEPKYNHYYFENKIVLIGVDKDIDAEEVSLFEDGPLQVYNQHQKQEENQVSGEIAGSILQLDDLRDRKALFDAVDEFVSAQKKKREFHGTYWEIFLDFLLFIKKETIYDFSVALSRVIDGNYEPKSLYDKLDKLKSSKGNPQAPTLELVELALYSIGVTEEIVETGEGIWYTFENKDKRYNLEEIYKYCKGKWEQKQEIVLKDMIMTISGLVDRDISEIPIRIWAKERLIDEKLKEFILILIEQLRKK